MEGEGNRCSLRGLERDREFQGWTALQPSYSLGLAYSFEQKEDNLYPSTLFDRGVSGINWGFLKGRLWGWEDLEFLLHEPKLGEGFSHESIHGKADVTFA